jgi:uncharacterized membrane protein
MVTALMTGRQNNSGIRYRWFHIYSFSKSYDSVNAFNELMIQILVLKGFFFPWNLIHKQTLKPVIFHDLTIKYKQSSIRIHCLLIVWILELHAVFFQKKSFGKKNFGIMLLDTVNIFLDWTVETERVDERN